MDSEWVAPILLVPKKIEIALEEIQNDAYENARIYKEKIKSLHDRMITRKEFNIGDSPLSFAFETFSWKVALLLDWTLYCF